MKVGIYSELNLLKSQTPKCFFWLRYWNELLTKDVSIATMAYFSLCSYLKIVNESNFLPENRRQRRGRTAKVAEENVTATYLSQKGETTTPPALSRPQRHRQSVTTHPRIMNTRTTNSMMVPTKCRQRIPILTEKSMPTWIRQQNHLEEEDPDELVPEMLLPSIRSIGRVLHWNYITFLLFTTHRQLWYLYPD